VFLLLRQGSSKLFLLVNILKGGLVSEIDLVPPGITK
jgi:hypothetical protein